MSGGKKIKLMVLGGIMLIAFFSFTCYLIKQENNDFRIAINQYYNQEDCFIDSRNNCDIESPDLYLIQKNAVKASSPPVTVTIQVLGSLGAEPETARKEIIEYVVEKGDCFSSIAEKFNIKTETILWANKLDKNSIIKQGQKLIILPVSGALYFVKSGDTISKIALSYKVNSDEIISFNNIIDNKIFIGDVLIIPGAKIPTPSYTYTAQIPFADSYFVFPCAGRISQRLHWYNAVDVANKCGTPIYAAAGGTVQKTGYIKIGGNRVRIIHPNGIVTYYGHLSKISVNPGQKISQGQLIGYMGRTGHATGCHIHFEVRGAKNPLAKYALGEYLKWK